MRRPVCSDAWQGHRKCQLPPNHSGNHSDGERFWRFAPETTPEPFVAEWRRRLTARDNTGAVLDR